MISSPPMPQPDSVGQMAIFYDIGEENSSLMPSILGTPNKDTLHTAITIKRIIMCACDKRSSSRVEFTYNLRGLTSLLATFTFELIAW